MPAEALALLILPSGILALTFCCLAGLVPVVWAERKATSSDATDATRIMVTGLIVWLILGVGLTVTHAWVVTPALAVGLGVCGIVQVRTPRGKQAVANLRIPAVIALAGLVIQAVMFLAALDSVRFGGAWFNRTFSFTGVTPGDGPVAYYQAQYIVNLVSPAHSMGGFTLIDRPIASGLLTAVFIAALGLLPVGPEAVVPGLHQVIYLGLWMGLNSLGAVALYTAYRWLCDPRRAAAIVCLVMVSPFFVVMSVGLWPKFLALFAAIGAIEALRTHRAASAGGFAGIAFLLHGSFLWFALALWGLLTLAVMFGRRDAQPALLSPRAWLLFSATMSVPIIGWFAFSSRSGTTSPLYYYYLYNAGVVDAITTDVVAIKQVFYQQVSGADLQLIGLANFLRTILPMDLSGTLSRSLVNGPPLLPSDLADDMVLAAWYRPPYVFGVSMLVVLLYGVIRASAVDWRVSLAVVALLAGYVPGFLLYRRDWYPAMHVMFYALIPLSVLLAAGVAGLRRRGLRTLAMYSLAEYAVVWLGRAHLPWQPRPPGYFPYCGITFIAAVILCLAGSLVVVWRLTADELPTAPNGAAC